MEGLGVGGVQNDIIFDNTVLALAARDCTINPAIGFTPLGPPPAITCGEDTTIGPCKTLSRIVDACDQQPLPEGCPSPVSNLSRFRAVIAATGAPNDNSIPSGVLYTCAFRVLDPSRLPVALLIATVVAANPEGRRLNAIGSDGQVTAPERSGSQSSSLSGDAEGGCTLQPASDWTALWLLVVGAPLLLRRRMWRKQIDRTA